MITAILVDDEKIIRLGLRKMITDHCPQITKIREAENGEEALALTLQEPPDICIVDMRMPRMSGLEYIARVRKLGLETKMIVLSGYADFSYAQQAIAEGCCGYLLKPVKIEALTELLQKTVKGILREREERRLAERGHHSQRRELQAQFYRAVAFGEAEVPALKEALDGRHYYAALFSLNVSGALYWPCRRAEQQAERPLDQADACLRRAGGEASWKIYSAVLDERTLYLLLLPPEEGMACASEAPAWLASAHAALAEEGIAGTMGFCGPFCGASPLHHSCLAGAEAVERRFYEGTGGLFLPAAEDLSDTEPALYSEERRFLTAMRVNKTDEAKEALHKVFACLKANRVKKEVCVLVCSHLHLNLLELLRGQSAMPISKSAQDTMSFREQLEIIDTFEELCSYVEALFLQTAHASREGSGAARSLVRNAVRYVEKHVDCPISVNEVADYLGVSVSYFSTLFRKETGEKFISFIIRYKIDRACERLEQTNDKIYEISEALGYTDVKYFCKIFRKYTGCTPSEYRESAGSAP